MKSLSLFILFLCISFVSGATVVTVSASSSGYTTTTTKTPGNMIVNGTTSRGYAVFNIGALGIPASAIISSVKLTYTYTISGSGAVTKTIYGYVGDISSLSAASLYTACVTGNTLYTGSWGSTSTTKTMTSNAAADTFIKRNLANTISVTWVHSAAGSFIYNITGAPSPYLTITYTCATPTGVIANASPTTVCNGSTLTLSGSVTGGSTFLWTGPNGFTSTLRNPGAITATSLSGGVYTFTATSACGVSTTATTTVTVKSAPVATTGASIVCVGNTTVLSNASAGGTWNSSSTSRASVNASTGAVFGRAAGAVNISYSTGCGTAVAFPLTVKGTPAAITGATGVCIGGTTTLANTTTGGTWSSASPATATINASTGVVTGVAQGATTITYDNSGCGTATYNITSNNAAPSIGGTASVCTGASTTLTNSTSGGVWTSSLTSRATVNPASGVVTGLTAGSVNISYTTGCGSPAVRSVTVSTSPAAISGTPSSCVGAVSTLSCTPSGGTWSSTNTGLATINTSGTVTGIATGTPTISYTRAGCASTATYTVRTATAAITGAANICAGTTVNVANSSIGGTWSSSNTSVATVHSTTGVVTGLTAGSVNISYSTGCSADAGTSLSVFTSPAAIAGTASVCEGAATTLTNATAGGSWSSSNTAVATVNPTTGAVYGVGQGTATISYAISSCLATRSQTTIGIPTAISGTSELCLGGSTVLTNDALGGTWTTSNAAIASVNTSGNVSTVAAGTANISYSTGCGSAAVATVAVGIAPEPITGTSSTCTANPVSLTQSVAGGTWSSSNASVATVSSTGTVTGLTEGAATMSYTLVNGCGTNTQEFPMTIAETGKWLGFNSDWNDAANWPCGTIPDSTINVHIPSGTTFVPDLSAAIFTVNNLTIDNGVVLPISGDAALRVLGSLANNGIVNGDGPLTMNGSTAQTFSGNGQISNFEINNAAGVAGTSGDTLNVSYELNVASGTLTTNGAIRLTSNVDHTARVAPVSGNISGNVTVEKFFEGGRRAYRFVGHPFSNSIDLTQIGSRIDVTGPNGVVNGFTATTSNAPSCYWYNPLFGNSALSYDPGWRNFTSAYGTPDSNKFKQHQGVRLYVRGAKGQGLGYTPYTPLPVVMSLTGNLNVGTQSINLRKGSQSDYNQVSNPFASPVNIGTAIAAAQAAGQVVGAAFYVWNPFLGAAGAFQSKPIGSSFIIEQCASFQVRAHHDNATLTIQESDKATDATDFLLKANPTSFVSLNVYDANNHQWDGTTIKFDNNATTSEDNDADAIKMTNPDLNFYSVASNAQALSIDARPFAAEMAIPLGFSSAYVQEFIIRADDINLENGQTLYLHDKALQTYTELTKGAEYRFMANSKGGSDRFELRTTNTNEPIVSNFIVNITPNPATDFVNIQFSNTEACNTAYQVVNAAGVTVMSNQLGNMQKGKATISVKDLATGIYQVILTAGSNRKVATVVVE